MEEPEALGTCYGTGSVVGAIIGTFFITLGLLGAGALLYNIYWRSRKGKHLVLVTDPENPGDQYAFDNPGFREATPIKQSLAEKPGRLEKCWLGNWSPLNVITPRGDKLRSVDDSCITDPEVRTVSLQSRDFTGLGFSVCGNMRDGIFVKDLLHHGPAAESGYIHPGDRIDSVCISFRHMVFEDALTILSYASPYEVQVQVESAPASRPSTLLRCKEPSDREAASKVRHPFYRSQSSADISLISKYSGKKSNQTNNEKSLDSSFSFSEYPTLKLTPSVNETKKEVLRHDKKALDTPDSGTDTLNRLHKFGIKVLPVSQSPKLKHNEQMSQTTNTSDMDTESKDVKALLTKGFQNLKEKLNQNTLGRKKKDIDAEEESATTENFSETVQVPEVVTRAGEAARMNRKSLSNENLMRRATPDCIDSGGDSSGEDGHGKMKKTKKKAPAPPQVGIEITTTTLEEVSPIVARKPTDLADEICCAPEDPPSLVDPPITAESDSEIEEREGCTHATVHHIPTADDPDTGRKAASLGDLSRLDAPAPAGPLERAVSLDLDASHASKKRKAPPPPPDDFPGYYVIKEPRLEGYNTFQRRLKKSSDFGTLEDALQEGNDSDPECFSSSPRSPKSPEPSSDHVSVAANNILEFSSWLAELRKPQLESGATLTLSVNSSDSKPEISRSTDEMIVQNNTTNFDEKVDEASVDVIDETDSSLPTTVSIAENRSDVILSVNGQILPEQSSTVLVISAEAESDEETPPQLPTSPIPTVPSSSSSSSLTYITEIKVSPSAELTTTKASKPLRKDSTPESSKIPIRTMKSETGQKVLAAIQSLAACDPPVEGEYAKRVTSIFNKEDNINKRTPPAVPPRRGDTTLSWSDDLAKDRNINGTPAHLPVKTSATKIVFEGKEINNEQF